MFQNTLNFILTFKLKFIRKNKYYYNQQKNTIFEVLTKEFA